MAVVFCSVFAAGALASGIRGDSYRVIGLFAVLFTLCFNVAFGRPSVLSQVARVMRERRRAELDARR